MDGAVPVGKVKFYMPPEVFARQAYSPAKVDVWTAGIILFVMLTKVHPFKYATAADARFMMVYQGKMNELLRRWGKEPLHPHAEDLLRRMLCPPESRMTVDEILSHPYVREESPSTERPLSSVDEEGKWQQPSASPQHSHYESNPSQPPVARQMLSPTSPSYHLPSALPVYPNAAAPTTSYAPSPSMNLTGPSPHSTQSRQQVQQLQPAYQHPLDAQHSHYPSSSSSATGGVASAHPSSSFVTYNSPNTTKADLRFAQLTAHPRPPPAIPPQQAPAQPISQRYQRTPL